MAIITYDVVTLKQIRHQARWDKKFVNPISIYYKVPLIYKWELNGKVYVGQTRNLRERLHCYYNTHSTAPTYIYRTVRKNIDNPNLTFSILELCDNVSELNSREEYWIKHFDSYNNGFNLTTGGDTPLEKSIEGRLRHIEKTSKKVFVFSKEREFLMEFSSLTNAGKHFGKRPQTIREALKRGALFLNNFYLSYTDSIDATVNSNRRGTYIWTLYVNGDKIAETNGLYKLSLIYDISEKVLRQIAYSKTNTNSKYRITKTPITYTL